MLQYIINSTAIWLMGLIVFDLFLVREKYHSYNRLYLLTILLAGVFVPLWSWGYDSFVYASGVSAPLAQQSADVKEAIVTGSEQTLLSVEDWLRIIYLVGVGIALVLFLKDIVLITSLYRKGKKSKDGRWTIVETSKAVSPFSAFRYIFISSHENYTFDELRMVLAHEEQHGRLLHFMDMLATRLTSILFWFNPLIFILEKRLLMVHEYQADAAVKMELPVYGKFLVEQSVLANAPAVAHSFIRSPLKKRILMMTRKTSSASLLKQVLIVPVLLLAMLCCTQNAFSFDKPTREGNKVTYRGNVIEFSDPGPNDTTIVIDPVTGEEKMILTRMDEAPIKLNGEKIYQAHELSDDAISRLADAATQRSSLTDEMLLKYIQTNIQSDIKKWKDGMYNIAVSRILVDKTGKVVYFELGDITKVIKGNGPLKRESIDKKTADKLQAKIATLINDAPAYAPAYYKAEAINSILPNTTYWSSFSVKNGKVEGL